MTTLDKDGHRFFKPNCIQYNNFMMRGVEHGTSRWIWFLNVKGAITLAKNQVIKSNCLLDACVGHGAVFNNNIKSIRDMTDVQRGFMLISIQDRCTLISDAEMVANHQTRLDKHKENPEYKWDGVTTDRQLLSSWGLTSNCANWNGAKRASISCGERKRPVHALVLEITTMTLVKKGDIARHKCQSDGICCIQEHLEHGTRENNNGVDRARDGTNGRKLSAKMVRDLFEDGFNGITVKSRVDRYKISESYIRSIDRLERRCAELTDDQRIKGQIRLAERKLVTDTHKHKGSENLNEKERLEKDKVRFYQLWESKDMGYTIPCSHDTKCVKPCGLASPCHMLKKNYKQKPSFNVLGIKMHVFAAALFLALGLRCPADQIVLHKCKSKRCVNSLHLEYGTSKQNGGPDRIRDGTAVIGEFNPNAKLTEAQVREIVDCLKLGDMTQKQIAEKYKVSDTTILQIKTGVNWSSVTKIAKPPKKAKAV